MYVCTYLVGLRHVREDGVDHAHQHPVLERVPRVLFSCFCVCVELLVLVGSRSQLPTPIRPPSTPHVITIITITHARPPNSTLRTSTMGMTLVRSLAMLIRSRPGRCENSTAYTTPEGPAG